MSENNKWDQVGHPRVRGRCPSCGAESLFLGSNGYVTCGVIGCKNPSAPTDVLEGVTRALQMNGDIKKALGHALAALSVANADVTDVLRRMADELAKRS